jgi:glycosyltransferase involved in cell wall biosynthesis
VTQYRIGIDARFYGKKSRGLGKYTQKLIKNLEKIDRKNIYYIFLRKENFKAFKPKNKNFKKRLLDIDWYSLKEQLVLPFALKKFKLDLIHFPHFNVPFFYSKPYLVTIHDLILLKHPTQRGETRLNFYLYKIKEFFYKIILKRALIKAKKIITVSNFTKKDILNYFSKNLFKNKIKVIYEGFDQNLFKSKVLANPKIVKNKLYLLYVGAAYPHKNLNRLVKAFNLLIKDNKFKDYRLILAGGDKNDFFYQNLKKLVQKNNYQNIIFAGLVSNKKLGCLYREATGFVYPSLYEGFGLPLLEAMQSGIPIAAANLTSIPEIAREAALYFKAKDPLDMKNKLSKLLLDQNSREELIKKGKQRVKNFSFKKMAKMTHKEYLQSVDSTRQK